MKTTHRLRRVLFLIFLLLAGWIAAPQPARADLIDDFAWVLDQVPGVFPVSGNDIRDSRALFEDLANVKSDTDVANILQKHKDTSLGKQATSAIGGIPSWFWDLIDTYIAFRTDDFWGVVGHLGKASICIVAQVLTGGTVDVCGLIEELVKLGKALLDAATAVAEFFQSIGEGAWEAAKAVGCSLGLGGCGKSSPPEQRAYAWVFAPEVPAGLTARKALDPFAFNTLRQQLEADASAKPAKLHIPAPDWLKENYSAGVVTTASNVYVKVVDAQWTADMAKNVLPQLAKKRTEYDNPQQVAALAQKAAVEYAKDPKTPPYTRVQNLCTDDFSKGFGYAHVDRWIAQFPGDAKGLGDVKSNGTWCLSSFWVKNKEPFGQHFRVYAKNNFCPELGQTLMCQTVSKYESCVGLLGSVGMSGQCGINLASAGKEAAEKIYAELKARGSKIPCVVKTDGQIISSKPADLVCPRPTQGHECGEIDKKLFSKIPVKLVNCVVEETADYKALRAKVNNSLTTLNQQYGGPFAVDLVDPLIVHASSADQVVKVQEGNPGFGFGPPSAKPGFDYYTFQFPRTIDGMNTPALGMEVKLPVATQTVQLDKIQEKLALVKPGDPDPTGKLSIGADKLSPSLAATPAAVAGAAQVQAQGPMQTMSGSLPPGSAPGTGAPKASLGAAPGSVSAAAGAGLAPKGPDLGGMPAPAPTQGKAPAGGSGATAPNGSAGAAKGFAGPLPGIAPPKPAGAAPPAPAPTQGAAPAAEGRQTGAVARPAPLPEIRSGPRVTVAGKHTVAWGQTVLVPDTDSVRAHNGVCEVAIRHDAKNAGTAASGPFARRWVNLQNPAPVTDTYPSIPSGGSVERTDTLPLKPGPNRLTLTLDHLNQVKEGNDRNNAYALTVTVTGSCGLPAPAAPPVPGRGVQPAPAPPTRLPAVQQPQVAPNPNQPRVAPPGR